jgi:uncharacterized protein YbbC (DUF1343 family)
VVDVGLFIAETLFRLYPKEFPIAKMARLLLDQPTLDALKENKPLSEIHAGWQQNLDEFQKQRAKYLLY